MKPEATATAKRHKSVSYAKWGYIFIAPFFIAYILCSLIPQLLTIGNAFFENYRSGLKQIGPNFVGMQNFVKLFTPDTTGSIGLVQYAGNTLALWVLCAIPQIVVAMLIAIFLTSYRLKIKGQPFFKAVYYMPNLIMASAFSMLIYALFSNVGPINQLIVESGWSKTTFDFFNTKWSAYGLIALMNFLMWFGNTTILLMAGIMGIDQSMFEAATIDGATPLQVFFRVTLPLLAPIIVYVVITAMIGGIQMFDVPQVLSKGLGTPNRSTMTLVMYLYSFLTPSKNFGMSGAVSVCIFIITAILSLIVFRSISAQYKGRGR